MSRGETSTVGRRPSSPAVARALTTLELLTEDEQPLSLTEIARRAHVPLASCSAIMRTLEDCGYAVEEVTGRTHYWRPTLMLYRLGARVMSRVALADVAQPFLERLAEELRIPAHAGVLEREQVIYVAKAAGPSFVQFHTFVGRSVPFHTTALGKAIAAFLPGDRLRSLVESSLQHHLGRSDESATLLAELEEARVAGYAKEDEEEYPGIGCLAAPVFDVSDRVAGAISVTGLSVDVIHSRRDEAVAAVRRTAGEISAALGASGVAGEPAS